MSSDVVVDLSHVWKRYRLGGRRRGVSHKRTLKGELAFALERSGLTQGSAVGPPGHIWALADVSFEVRRGEGVGIIGANGCGKSTTLKLISGITRPWAGRVRARGRIGSLIEIRSGIHPELTGRENIELYGTILGLRRREVRKKFDDIVEFAELGRYIDTPVKRYSSGMEVRLGFSVAVHVEPDVLLVDEVLAVGDASFQRRCLERMDRMRAAGQTVVFVSHVMEDVARLCSRALYLDRGVVRADGPVHEVSRLYLEDVQMEAREAPTVGPAGFEPATS
jgi:homopolymeric O-antigen transport system ATP-binding protein